MMLSQILLQINANTWVWWHMSVFPGLGRKREMYQQFKFILSSTEPELCMNLSQQKKRRGRNGRANKIHC